MENVPLTVVVGVVIRLICELILKVTYCIVAKIKNRKKNDDRSKDHRS